MPDVLLNHPGRPSRTRGGELQPKLSLLEVADLFVKSSRDSPAPSTVIP